MCTLIKHIHGIMLQINTNPIVLKCQYMVIKLRTLCMKLYSAPYSLVVTWAHAQL